MSFKEKVWELAKKIPKGKVTTYAEIARELDSKAYRAVGTALRKNPFAPKVPCHRVINSSGFIGNYSKGISKKAKLLTSEGIRISKGRKVLDLKKHMFTFS
ncbi:MGMT family protein [Candidatus Woesearchaeota archaeon]|nr:MGMT family protein [Candidatus Woesearchaeota archaeon]